MQISSLRFLVVDDVAAIRKLVVNHLTTLGVTSITEAVDGKEAWALMDTAATLRWPYQFLICDWNMPLMSGLQLLRLARAHPSYKNVVFLMATSEADVSKVLNAVTQGVDGYLVKPFSAAAFNEKLFATFFKRFPT